MLEPLHAVRIALVESSALALVNEFNAFNLAPANELLITLKNDGGVWFGDVQYIASGMPVSCEGF